MGLCQSYSVFTEYELDLYQQLTKLTRAEILHAYRKFHDIDPLAFMENKKGRISFVTVADTLPQLAVNPFRYRMCQIFCSSDTGFMDFDDFLELVMIMSDRVPLASKLPWAFQIYDFSDDDAICAKDLNKMMDILTGGKMPQDVKDKIIASVLKETDLDHDGAMSFQEFERVMTLKAAPEFMQNFRFIL